jgi:uncharacterized damage-inducible protein DinB
MVDVTLPYRAMAYNNGWANHRLLTACSRLSQSEFIMARTGFFPSLRATLNHILIVDLFYVDAMEGGTLGPAAWADPEPYATMDVLRPAQRELDNRLIAVANSLDARDLTGMVEALIFSGSGWTGCFFIYFSIRSTTGGRHTRC